MILAIYIWGAIVSYIAIKSTKDKGEILLKDVSPAMLSAAWFLSLPAMLAFLLIKKYLDAIKRH